MTDLDKVMEIPCSITVHINFDCTLLDIIPRKGANVDK